MPMQLTIEGREVELSEVARRSSLAPLTDAQRDILLVLRDKGEIRSFEAGGILHFHRRERMGVQWCGPVPVGDRALSCCTYASSDGCEAMKRLAVRGLARHSKHSLWRLPS